MTHYCSHRLQVCMDYLSLPHSHAADQHNAPQTPETEAQLNSLEQGTLEDVVGLLQSCQYRLLDRSEWEAAKSEDFLVGDLGDVRW